MSGRDFDLVEPDGTTVLRVRHLWPADPVECGMCGRDTFDNYAVPWYCGPVLDGENEGGYRCCCKPCHDRWAVWNDAMQYHGA